MEGIVLDRFAESIRREIAACDHVDLLGERRVTASVGVGEVRPACDFQRLYRIADDALYEAKHAGRDQVALQRHRDGNGPSTDPPDRAPSTSRYDGSTTRPGRPPAPGGRGQGVTRPAEP